MTSFSFVFINLEEALLHSIDYEQMLLAQGERFEQVIILDYDTQDVATQYTMIDG